MAIEIIELNPSNCREYTDEEFMAKLNLIMGDDDDE